MQLQTLINFLEKIFPLELAEDWDNVGLTLGDRRQKVKKVLTCLTVDAAVADEAIELDADCIVSHHPFPFRAEKKWTSDDTAGELLLKLARAGIAVYSPHTAHDSAFFGVNRQLAEGLELVDVKPLYPGKLVATREMLDGLDPIDAQEIAREFDAPRPEGKDKKPGKKFGALAPDEEPAGPTLGTGRIGRFAKPKKFSELVAQVKNMLQIERLLAVGDDDKLIRSVAIGCGAADDFIDQAVKEGADAMLLGEARFHACLEARAKNLGLVLAGHYATERFSACILADRIARKFPELTAVASAKESDPLRVV